MSAFQTDPQIIGEELNPKRLKEDYHGTIFSNRFCNISAF
jgi:hypothetical protein